MVVGMMIALGRCTTRDERKKKWEESRRQIQEEAEKLRGKMEIEMKVFFKTSEDKVTLEQWKGNVRNKIVQSNENQKRTVSMNCLATYDYFDRIDRMWKK